MPAKRMHFRMYATNMECYGNAVFSWAATFWEYSLVKRGDADRICYEKSKQ